MNACTIIAKNHLAFARVLARSFNEQHPDGRFTVLVLDDIEGRFDPTQEPFAVVSPADIDVPEFEQLAGAYDVQELSTAVRPWLLRRLLRERDVVVYLDADVRLYGPLQEVDELAVEHGIVLAPHNVTAVPRDGKKPSEADTLAAGAYDPGFIAVSDAKDSRVFLDWWAERPRSDWVDVVPGMVPSFARLRDPAYNVAYWNLPSGALSRNGVGYQVEGQPLRFLHFSGYDPCRPYTLSRYQEQVDLVSLPVLRELCDAYAAELLDEDYERTIEWPYTYTETANGLPLIDSLRRTYADGLRKGELTRSVFETRGADDLVEYAKGPAGGDLDPRLTRYAMSVYESRRDLREVFPTLTGEHLEWFLNWFAEYGAQELGPELSALSGVDPKVRLRERPDVQDAVGVNGVNLVGYFSAELGVGEVGRQVAGAFDAVDVPVLPIGLVASKSRQGHAFGQRRGLSGPFEFNLLCVNADQTANVARMAGSDFFEDRYTIGWWWWEINHFPDRWLHAFDRLDELWVGSRFVADTLAPLTTKPVILMPTPVELPAEIHADRARFGLEPNAFAFLVVFDHNSVFERKNPVGAIEAYKLAFSRPRDDVRLVIKSINAHTHPDRQERLRYAADGRSDIVLMDEYLSAPDKNTLVASCDAYVSLHRSEGFGISLAEAMLLGKPVIASDYSGSADFIRPDTAYPVPCTMTEIGPGNEPYMADAMWADPDLDVAAKLMAAAVTDPAATHARAAAGTRWISQHYSARAAGRAMRARLEHLRRLNPELGVDYTQRMEVVAEKQRELSHRGPAPSGSGRFSPKRLVRRLIVGTNRPVILYAEELHREMANALVEANEIASEMAESAHARADATTLAYSRRLEARIAALEGALEQARRRAGDV